LSNHLKFECLEEFLNKQGNNIKSFYILLDFIGKKVKFEKYFEILSNMVNL